MKTVEREPEADPWLGRALSRVLLAALQVGLLGLSYGVLAFQPRLFDAWARLRRLRHRQRPDFAGVLMGARQGQEVKELVYVDTPPSTALWLLWRNGVGPESSVMDLGAGRGALLLGAKFLGAEARGVELLASRVEPAQPILRKVGIDLFDGDATEQDLFGVSHVVVTWTAMSESTRERISQDLLRLEPGAKALVYTHKMKQEGFRKLHQHLVLLPWGADWVYVYRRV